MIHAYSCILYHGRLAWKTRVLLLQYMNAAAAGTICIYMAADRLASRTAGQQSALSLCHPLVCGHRRTVYQGGGSQVQRIAQASMSMMYILVVLRGLGSALIEQ